MYNDNGDCECGERFEREIYFALLIYILSYELWETEKITTRRCVGIYMCILLSYLVLMCRGLQNVEVLEAQVN